MTIRQIQLSFASKKDQLLSTVCLGSEGERSEWKIKTPLLLPVLLIPTFLLALALALAVTRDSSPYIWVGEVK